MPSFNEACLPLIAASSTLEERAAVYYGLRKQGWATQQAEAAIGLLWTFDGELGDSVRIVELVPCPMVKQ